VCVVAPNGERWSHRGDHKIGAASTVKIPLMVEIFRSIERGERALDDRHILRDEDIARGSGVLLHLHLGIEVTLADLLYLMISISDNTATNMLIRMAGMDAVNRTMRALEMSNSVLAREMKGRPALPSEGENWATADDYANAVLAILDNTAASAESCAAMLDLLSKQQNSRRIARYLPEREDVRWGSKTGSVKGVTNDVGFVTTDAGTLVVAVFCADFPDQHIGEQVIGEIARAACSATGVVEPPYTS
jgi:beta-lactamase class A